VAITTLRRPGQAVAGQVRYSCQIWWTSGRTEDPDCSLGGWLDRGTIAQTEWRTQATANIGAATPAGNFHRIDATRQKSLYETTVSYRLSEENVFAIAPRDGLTHSPV